MERRRVKHTLECTALQISLPSRDGRRRKQKCGSRLPYFLAPPAPTLPLHFDSAFAVNAHSPLTTEQAGIIDATASAFSMARAHVVLRSVDGIL